MGPSGESIELRRTLQFLDFKRPESFEWQKGPCPHYEEGRMSPFKSFRLGLYGEEAAR